VVGNVPQPPHAFQPGTESLNVVCAAKRGVSLMCVVTGRVAVHRPGTAARNARPLARRDRV